MIKIRNHLNAHKCPRKGEVFTQPSLTVPDQSMTLTEIVTRYAKGLPFDNERTGIYDEDENDILPDFRTMDIVDQQDYLEKRFGDLKDRVDNLKSQKKKQELDKYFEQRLADYLKQKDLDNGFKPNTHTSAPPVP